MSGTGRGIVTTRASRVLAALAATALFAAACAPAPVRTIPSSGRSNTMKVTSSAFSDKGRIPKVFVSTRGGGEDRSIPVAWSDVPSGTASFAVAIVDHAPVAHDWVHWAVVDIPPTITSLAEGASGTMPPPVRELTGTAGRPGYSGPMPPPGSGDHPYEVTVYALSVRTLDVPGQPTAAQIEAAVQGKVLASGSVTGMYSQ